MDFIFTDPPYLKEFLPLYGDLSSFAARVLKPGGFILAYCGTHHLDSVMKMLGEHLHYHWQCILRHSDCTSPDHDRKVFCGYKPLLLYSKGKAQPLDYIRDVIDGTREKTLHPWQQGVGEAKYYIEHLTKPGDLIVDGFGGSFTTAEAVLRLGGRKFIGCDVDPGCVAIGLERIAKVRAELAKASVKASDTADCQESGDAE